MTKKTRQDNRPLFEKDALSFIPMGGSGEFGCNLNVYHCNGKFLLVDCGMGFPEDDQLGLDAILPDPGFLREVQDDIVGLVVTHAHDDHKGAIAALWPQLNCPIYASPFTLELIRTKLGEWNLLKRVSLHKVALGSTINLEPFEIEFINTAHSVVESSMLFIKTPHGNVLHTGDWRNDQTPVEGKKTDIDRLKKLSNDNILAIIGDSTNAVVEGRHPSEQELLEPLTTLFKHAEGRVVLTTFSHSVPRMRSVVNAAEQAGRAVGMVGRSMMKVQEIARKTGYLKNVPPFLHEKELLSMDRRKTVILATGSQGEPGSAIDRLSKDEHPTLTLEAGDTIVFSAREIPGNQKKIERVHTSFMRRGIHVVIPETGFTHASGHACAGDMKELFDWVKPKALIPVHGSEQNQWAYVEIAKSCNVQSHFVPANGDIIAIRETGVEKSGHVASGAMAVDGSRVVPVKDSLLLLERSRIANDGSIVATVVIDEEGYLIHDPIFSIAGLGSDDDDVFDLEEILMTDVEKAIDKAKDAERKDAEVLREIVRLAIRRRIKQELGKRPLLDVHLILLT